MGTESMRLPDEVQDIAIVNDAFGQTLDTDCPIEIIEETQPTNWFDERAQEFDNTRSIIGFTDGTIDGLNTLFLGDEAFYQKYLVESDITQEVRIIREPLQDTPEQRTYHKDRNALSKATLVRKHPDPKDVKAAAIHRLDDITKVLAKQSQRYEAERD